MERASKGRKGGFQFLGIPPKGELDGGIIRAKEVNAKSFPISRDPPEGGTVGMEYKGFKVTVSNF